MRMKNMSATIKTHVVCWCPGAKMMVEIVIQGMSYGNIVEGTVIECSELKNCGSTEFCWLGREITINRI
jgi:hypothetical protein